MFYDNGSTPDDIAAAAGEISTEIGAAPPENGGGTSATASASSLGETARVLLAPPSTPPDDLANAAGETSTGFGVAKLKRKPRLSKLESYQSTHDERM